MIGYFVNKIVWAFLSPLSFIFILTLVTLVAAFLRRKWAKWTGLAAVILLWLFSSPLGPAALGLPLESPYWPESKAEAYENADAILLLGGGICGEVSVYPDVNDAGDRVWHAARLFKAGKAPVVVTSGYGDKAAAVPLLIDLGVPAEAIRCENESLNTRQNMINTMKMIGEASGKASPKVLVVTSAWHMRRSMLNAKQVGLDAIPAPSDYQANYGWRHDSVGMRNWFLPEGDNMRYSCQFAKEWVGILERIVVGGL